MQKRNTGQVYGVARGELLKPAALLFDKIYLDPRSASDWNVPLDLTFEFPEVKSSIEAEQRAEFQPLVSSFRDALLQGETPPAFLKGVVDGYLRAVVRAHLGHGISLVPLFESDSAFSREYPVGEEVAWQAVLNHLPVVTSDLEWRQVVEFRSDQDSVRKYRALRVWLREVLSSKSIMEATDVLGSKLDDYEWAIRKHGLKTITGVLSEVIDSKTLGALTASGAVVALLTQPVWGLLSSGALAIAKVGVWVAERRLEEEGLRRGENCAIAFIHEIRQLLEGA